MATTSGNGVAVLEDAEVALATVETALKEAEGKVAPERDALEKAEAAVTSAKKKIADERAKERGTGLRVWLSGWINQNDQTVGTVAFAAVCLAGTLLIALIVHKHAPFTPGSGFLVFGGFYVVAQAIERLIELLSLSPLPPNSTAAKAASEEEKKAAEKKTTARKTLVFAAFSVLVGAAASVGFGLYFLRAVGVTSPAYWLDVLVTALLLSGGTKALHDLIENVTAAKDQAKANA